MSHQFAARRVSSSVRAAPTWTDAAQPLPPPVGAAPYRLDISAVLPAGLDPAGYVFHTVGDVGGVKTPSYQQTVAAAMEQNPASFTYLLGDVAYFNGQRAVYHDQFYEPYAHLDWPFFAIPGNHDGDPIGGDTSLAGFMANFCQPQPGQHLPEAQEVPRTAMTQPYCYWTLTTPLVTFVGLYTNVPEGGYVDQAQQQWFASELQAADPEKLLVVATHHPVFSIDAYHSGSQTIRSLIDQATGAAGRGPDLVLAGHVHDYQRWVDGAGRTTVVAGAGGYYNLHRLIEAPGWTDPATGATIEAGVDDVHGYLSCAVTPGRLEATYYACAAGAQPTVRDTFVISLPSKGQST